MNRFELINRWNLEAQKYGLKKPVQTTVMEDWINYAYQEYITELYDKNKGLYNDYFEMDERTSVILAPLLVDHTDTIFASITTNSPYGYYVQKPVGFQYMVKESAIINTVDCDNVATLLRCKVIPVKHNQVEANKDNPFFKPEGNEIWRLNYSDRLELILYSGVTLASYTFRYLKKQTAVSFSTNVTMEIDSSVHEEIVLRAFNKFYFDLTKQTQGNG